MYVTTIPVDHTSYHATNHTTNRAVGGKNRPGDPVTSQQSDTYGRTLMSREMSNDIRPV